MFFLFTKTNRFASENILFYKANTCRWGKLYLLRKTKTAGWRYSMSLHLTLMKWLLILRSWWMTWLTPKPFTRQERLHSISIHRHQRYFLIYTGIKGRVQPDRYILEVWFAAGNTQTSPGGLFTHRLYCIFFYWVFHIRWWWWDSKGNSWRRLCGNDEGEYRQWKSVRCIWRGVHHFSTGWALWFTISGWIWWYSFPVFSAALPACIWKVKTLLWWVPLTSCFMKTGLAWISGWWYLCMAHSKWQPLYWQLLPGLFWQELPFPGTIKRLDSFKQGAKDGVKSWSGWYLYPHWQPSLKRTSPDCITMLMW